MAWPRGLLAQRSGERQLWIDGSANALPFSLAGVQLKFSAFENAGKDGGLTIPAKGVGGSWILKLPSQQFTGVPESEFSLMTIARMIGMDMPAINLIDLDAITGIPEGVGELKGQALASAGRAAGCRDGSRRAAGHVGAAFRRYRASSRRPACRGSLTGGWARPRRSGCRRGSCSGFIGSFTEAGTLKHFHEHLREPHNFAWGYTWTKAQLHAAGLIERARRRGTYRRKRPRKGIGWEFVHACIDDASRVAFSQGLAGREEEGAPSPS